MPLVCRTLGPGLILGLALAGCPAPEPLPPKPPPRSKVHLRAFTETSPVTALATINGFVFANKGATLERWSGEQVLELSGTHGLPGARVLALAADSKRGWLWIATDGGVGYYDGKRETFEAMPSSPLAIDLGVEAPPPPAPIAPGAGASARPASPHGPVAPAPPVPGAPGLPAPSLPPRAAPPPLALAAAVDGGLWIGHPRGLFYVSAKGGWTSTPIADPINALHAGRDGWLWIGSDRGLIGRDPAGKTFQFGPAQGCEVVTVRWIAAAPGSGVIVVGEDAGGRQRIAIGRGGIWSSYKLSPNVRWNAGTPVGDALVVMTGDGLYAVRAGPAPVPEPLSRDGARLLSVNSRSADVFHIMRLPAALPAGATTLGADDRGLLVGTQELGVARIPLDSRVPLGWLRRAAMLDGAGALTVLCQAKDDCWLATGAPHAWRWHGESFVAAGPPDDVVLAMVRGQHGALYGLHRKPDGRAIEISRIEGETWTPLGIRLETPGPGPEVSFARIAPSGQLWVGLRYRDDGELRPWGIATVDLDLGAVAYHHASLDPGERKLGILPVPVGVVDAAFLGEDEVWMASRQGAVRMTGDQVTVWNEGTQLVSELLNAVAVTAGGLVFVASPDGVGTYDGERWRFPPELRFTTNDLALGADSRLWLATERGVAIYDGKKVRRLDVRRGMVENQVLDITLDELGRVWTRGPHSLAVITP